MCFTITLYSLSALLSLYSRNTFTCMHEYSLTSTTYIHFHYLIAFSYMLQYRSMNVHTYSYNFMHKYCIRLTKFKLHEIHETYWYKCAYTAHICKYMLIKLYIFEYICYMLYVLCNRAIKIFKSAFRNLLITNIRVQ
jgi:hypothetical protein